MKELKHLFLFSLCQCIELTQPGLEAPRVLGSGRKYTVSMPYTLCLLHPFSAGLTCSHEVCALVRPVLKRSSLLLWLHCLPPRWSRALACAGANVLVFRQSASASPIVVRVRMRLIPDPTCLVGDFVTHSPRSQCSLCSWPLLWLVL
jgi:hypothetical protein